jgi:riboflavin synthase
MQHMFTGIVEHVAPAHRVVHDHRGSTLELDLGPLADGTKVGDSICVSGVCLTIERLSAGLAHFQISPQTRAMTTVSQWQSGRALNLERALVFGQRLGGHLLSGHVDGVGTLEERQKEGNSERFTVRLPENGSVTVVEKGSLGVDGVSLTTWACRGARCAIAVIPFTLSHTALCNLRPGMRVNLEQDVIGRWVEKLMAKPAPGAPA